MNWPVVIWSMLAAACLTLTAIHLPIWLRDRAALPSLFFALMSLSTAALVFTEAWLMHTLTPEQYGDTLRWMHLPIWMVLVSLLAFVYVYLEAGRLWLAALAIGVRTAALALNFTTGLNINILEITQLQRVDFLGGPVSIAIGVPNPWVWVAQLGLVLCLVFIVDASVTAWRQGKHLRVALIGGSSIFWVLAAGVQAALIQAAGLRMPTTTSLFFLPIVAAMAYAAGRYLLEARRLAMELGESEQRMTLAVGAARIGIWTRELATGEVWANLRWRELFGFTATEQLTMEQVFARLHPEDRERLRPHMAPTTQSPDIDRPEFRVLLPNGQVRWISSQGKSEVNSHGRLVRTRGASIDITARKDSERELLLLRSEIAHVGRVSVMGQLATALAHEINQPLGAILRNAEAAILYLQAERPDLNELRAIVEDIRKDDQRAGAVIDRMRMLLRRQDVNMQPLMLPELFGEVAALLRPEAMARHVKLEVAVGTGVPPVAGDRVHLQQVLLNLVSNGMDSIDESSRNGRTVAVSAVSDGRRSVVIAVKDTGRGLAPDHMTQLFEPFFTTKTKGMGMGLCISRTIVEAHGGRLWAENNDEGGARFSFTVPIAGGAE